MKTKIEWPKTYYEIGGLMGFSSEYVDYTAGDYKRWVVPIVTKAIEELENEIESLKLQLQNKPKFKWSSAGWVLVNEKV